MGCGGSSIVNSSGVIEVTGPNGGKLQVGKGSLTTVTGTGDWAIPMASSA